MMKKFSNSYLYCVFIFIFLILCATYAFADNYCIVDQNGNVVNNISWDGVQPYAPPSGDIVVACPTEGIGWTYINGVWTPPTEN
jgi:hypothetical protein